MAIGATALSVLAYSFCSGTMLLINKLAIHHLGCPTMVSAIQLIAATVWCLGIKYTGCLAVDDFEWAKVKPYLYYVVLFTLGVWTNMKSLEVSNVDTVIVFRACTPLAVAIMDFFFLGRELPGRRSAAALGLLGLGAFGYVASDAQFALAGFAAYYCVTAYFFLICVEMTYGKRITSSVKMATVSGSVMYTNFFAWGPMLAIAASVGELQKFKEVEWTAPGAFYLTLSCVVGTAISYCGWWCRGRVSATTFTLVGVINKVLTVLLNVVIWDKHASPVGLAFLLLCLGGGALYKQAPMRAGAAAAAAATGGRAAADVAVDVEATAPLNASPSAVARSGKGGGGGIELK
ncbi:hypothetical protein JKP88DRAFT_332652 [Tribonema minus]|uniref:Sugar phosphate transporter domain-containing protein n=1 Tax=Tribonema minus TaxID=303371 RepID=A0A836C9E8_9STRA|nr:hypothetical protein JKP88DRAFT_332652 [Tribonema minus]